MITWMNWKYTNGLWTANRREFFRYLNLHNKNPKCPSCHKEIVLMVHETTPGLYCEHCKTQLDIIGDY